MCGALQATHGSIDVFTEDAESFLWYLSDVYADMTGQRHVYVYVRVFPSVHRSFRAGFQQFLIQAQSRQHGSGVSPGRKQDACL